MPAQVRGLTIVRVTCQAETRLKQAANQLERQSGLNGVMSARAIAAEIRSLPPLGSPREGFSRQFSVNCYSRDAYSFESRDWLW